MVFFSELFTTYLWNQIRTFGLYYRPLFSVWLLIVHTIGGFSPWVWHLSSVFLHAVATYLVFRLCLELVGNLFAAGSSALLFAVHPIHIESVCWVSASEEILYTVFVLASLLLLSQSLHLSSRVGFRVYLSALAWTAALLCKETAIAVLPIFFILAYKMTVDSLAGSARLKRTMQLGLPFLGSALAYLAVRSLVLEGVGLETGQHTWRQVLCTSPSVFAFYIRKLVWPTLLSGFYANPVFSNPTAAMWLTLVLIIIGILAFSWFALNRSVAISLGIALILLPIVPVLAGIRIFKEGDMAHDRYLYLPSVGLVLLLCLLMANLWSRGNAAKSIASIVFSFLLLASVWLNFTQQSFYRDDEHFYRRAIESNPQNALAMDFLGDYYFYQNQPDRAVEEFRKAHDLEPEDPIVTVYLAKGLFATQQYEAAEPFLNQLTHDTRLKPAQRLEAMVAFAQVEINLGHLSAAEAALTEVQSENDMFPGLHFTLGKLYEKQGKVPEARNEYLKEYRLQQLSPKGPPK